MAKRALPPVLGALLAGASPCAAQEGVPLRSVVGIEGVCTRLVTPGEDRSARCEGPAINFNYEGGRFSFAFKDGRAALISFSGTGGAGNGDGGRLVVDLVTVATMSASDGGVDTAGAPATGACDFTNFHRGRATIRCGARTAAGDYAAEFTSSGAPPDVTEFPERN
jgi:hypothetical protein